MVLTRSKTIEQTARCNEWNEREKKRQMEIRAHNKRLKSIKRKELFLKRKQLKESMEQVSEMNG